MTVTIELPPEIEERFREEAAQRGISLQDVVAERLRSAATFGQRQVQTDEMDRFFEDLAALVPEGTPPLSDQALSRESIYTREDEW